MVQFVPKKDFVKISETNHTNFETPSVKKRGTALKDFILVKGNFPMFCKTDKKTKESILLSDKRQIGELFDTDEQPLFVTSL